MVDQVLDKVFAARPNGVMQQREAVCVLQVELRPLLVEFLQLKHNKNIKGSKIK